MISQKKKAQLKELEYLKKTGTLDIVLDRMKNADKDNFVDL